jgi:hypothetical protein
MGVSNNKSTNFLNNNLGWAGGSIRHVDITSGKYFKYAILRYFYFILSSDICGHISLVVQCY